jgi:hypothetical protein
MLASSCQTDSFLKRPAGVQSTPKGRSFNPDEWSNLRQGKPFPLKIVVARSAFIIVLFCCSSPFAIVWAVSLVVIFSLQGKPWWAHSHVFKKCFERLAPAVAHQYSASSISIIGFTAGDMASSFCVKPNYPFSACGATVLCESRDGHFRLKTATASSVSTAQVIRHNRDFSSAVTFAEPESSYFSTRKFFRGFLGYYSKTFKLLSEKIHNFHDCYYNTVINGLTT